VYYEVIGYPPGWGSRGCGKGGRGGHGQGCGGRGPSRGSRTGPARETAATAMQESGPVTEADGLNTSKQQDIGKISIPGLSSQQVQRLLSLIDGPGNGHENYQVTLAGCSTAAGHVTWLVT